MAWPVCFLRSDPRLNLKKIYWGGLTFGPPQYLTNGYGPCKTIMLEGELVLGLDFWSWVTVVGGWEILLIVECQINTTMERKSSKLSGAQYRKKRKEEEEKRAKDKRNATTLFLYDYGYPCNQWRANVVGGITLTLTFVSLLAMMLAMLIQQ